MNVTEIDKAWGWIDRGLSIFDFKLQEIQARSTLDLLIILKIVYDIYKKNANQKYAKFRASLYILEEKAIDQDYKTIIFYQTFATNMHIWTSTSIQME